MCWGAPSWGLPVPVLLSVTTALKTSPMVSACPQGCYDFGWMQGTGSCPAPSHQADCFGAREGACCPQHPPAQGGLELLELGRLQGSCCTSYLLPADPVQAESISIPILWPLKK